MTSIQFRRQFRNLILLTWLVPPVFGLSSIIYIGVLTPAQMLAILSTPVEPVYCLGSLLLALWYLPRVVRPVSSYLQDPAAQSTAAAIDCIKYFPLHFWAVFLVYLAVAPSTVILSAEWFTDFVARPVDWFRIHLIALIVSIIVGLPIFFLIYDLFGRVMSQVHLTRPHVTIKLKVFLIGALVPLLIDTMLVQYYWTRTGYFTYETFIVWLSLELLAIGGSLIFVRSIAQSIAPLQQFIADPGAFLSIDVKQLNPQSTDEFGVLTSGYKRLLFDLQLQSEILQLNNRLLRDLGVGMDLADVAASVIALGDKTMAGNKVFLMFFDEASQELVDVIHTGVDYKPQGHYRLALDEVSMATMVYKAGSTTIIDDVQNDPRCSPRMYEKFNVHSALAVPLIVEGQTVGVLMSTTTEIRHRYSDRQIALMEGLAREVAIAVYSHRLLVAKEEAYEEVRRHREHLEELVQERTDELTRVNRELEAFSYSVSHDLRAPLRAIDGFSLALMEDYIAQLDDTGQDYLQRIRRGAQRMELLIDDMLQLAKVTRSNLTRKRINLSQIALAISQRLQQEHLGNEVEFTIQPGLTAVADEAAMIIVMENLLGNAVKYSSKNNQAKIEVSARNLDGETVYCVRDNGVGFDMQFQDKLFVPFQRLHSGNEFEGTGVGLATVARIIHKHGGRVWAESALEKGASFFFTLK